MVGVNAVSEGPIEEPHRQSRAERDRAILEALQYVSHLIPEPGSEAELPKLPKPGKEAFSKRLLDITDAFDPSQFEFVTPKKNNASNVNGSASASKASGNTNSGYYKLRRAASVDRLGTRLTKKYRSYANFVSDVKDMIRDYDTEYRKKCEATYKLSLEITREKPGVFIVISVVDRSIRSEQGRPRGSTRSKAGKAETEDIVTNDTSRKKEKKVESGDVAGSEPHDSIVPKVDVQLPEGLRKFAYSDNPPFSAKEIVNEHFLHHPAGDLAGLAAVELANKGRFSTAKEAADDLERFTREISALN